MNNCPKGTIQFGGQNGCKLWPVGLPLNLINKALLTHNHTHLLKQWVPSRNSSRDEPL